MSEKQCKRIDRAPTPRQLWILRRLENGVRIRRTSIPGLLLWTDGRAENESDIDELVRAGLLVKG